MRYKYINSIPVCVPHSISRISSATSICRYKIRWRTCLLTLASSLSRHCCTPLFLRKVDNDKLCTVTMMFPRQSKQIHSAQEVIGSPPAQFHRDLSIAMVSCATYSAVTFADPFTHLQICPPIPRAAIRQQFPKVFRLQSVLLSLPRDHSLSTIH